MLSNQGFDMFLDQNLTHSNHVQSFINHSIKTMHKKLTISTIMENWD